MSAFSYIRKWVLVTLVVLIAATPVRADSQAIEMYGGRWTSYTVGVKVPSTPAWMRAAVLDAMQTWNEAQQWFAKEYFPGNRTYTLQPSDEGRIVVRFQNLSSGARYCALGQETVPSRSGTAITQALMILTAYCANKPLDQRVVYFVAIHEFGHALGIGHTNFDEPHDVMTAWYHRDWKISTLDLYALHVLASGPAAPLQILTLPKNISYDFLQTGYLPEFSQQSILVFLPLLLFASVSFSRLRRSRTDPIIDDPNAS